MTFDQALAQAQSIAFLEFAWDEWAVPDAYQNYSTGYEDIFDSLSDAANLALAIALGEWLVSALREYDKDHEAKDAVWACWAVFSETHFPIYSESDDDEWEGPHREMLAMVFTMLNDAIFCLHESTVVGMRTDWLLMYCQMVFRKEPLFLEWLDHAVAALQNVQPDRSSNYEFGVIDPRLVYQPPVSRRFFDLDRPYDAIREASETSTFVLKWLVNNPFVDEG